MRLVFLLLVLIFSHAGAQTYPVKPVKLALPAGNGTTSFTGLT